MTDEQELLLECWLQFSIPSNQDNDKTKTIKFKSGALSVLKDLGSYLYEKKLINENGEQIC